jgi:flavin reductase (DIM6/NTAB) family NADH-FMN oxidoreductase RutF
MLTLQLKDLSPAAAQNYLQHAVAPRPICFASTIDHTGQVNLSPFSFFNIFSSNPPILIFSPARRVRDNSTKHTLQNVDEIREVVINMVDYDMVQQMSLSSCDYPKQVNEFIKAGFTEQSATMVRPPMVKESKVKFECKVNDIIPLGETGGAGNLVICEVLCMHIDESILNGQNQIDQEKLHLVARLGGDWYCKIEPSALFKVAKPNIELGIGIDRLPEGIRKSSVLTGNQLAQLANVHEMPVVLAEYDDARLREIIQYFGADPTEMEKELHKHAAQLLHMGRVTDAWQVLLSAEQA